MGLTEEAARDKASKEGWSDQLAVRGGAGLGRALPVRGRGWAERCSSGCQLLLAKARLAERPTWQEGLCCPNSTSVAECSQRRTHSALPTRPQLQRHTSSCLWRCTALRTRPPR